MPIEADIGKAYVNYSFTHQSPVRFAATGKGGGEEPSRILRRSWQFVKRGYLGATLGYDANTSGVQRLCGQLLRIQPFFARSVANAVRRVPFVRGGRLLDVGCGDGSFGAYAQSLGWEVQGVEVDPQAVSAARARGLLVHEGTLPSVGLPTGAFDAVTLTHVIEHVHDPRELLLQCHRVLRPGGCIALYTPNAESAGHRTFGADWIGLDPPRHLHVFTAASLARLATDVGFSFRLSTTAEGSARFYAQSRAIRDLAANASGTTTFGIRGWTFDLVESLAVLAGFGIGDALVLHGVKL